MDPAGCVDSETKDTTRNLPTTEIHPFTLMRALPFEQVVRDQLHMGAGARWVAEASSYDTARHAALYTWALRTF
jgi:hypothetical protein